jgi:hypothetical protein
MSDASAAAAAAQQGDQGLLDANLTPTTNATGQPDGGVATISTATNDGADHSSDGTDTIDNTPALPDGAGAGATEDGTSGDDAANLDELKKLRSEVKLQKGLLKVQREREAKRAGEQKGLHHIIQMLEGQEQKQTTFQQQVVERVQGIEENQRDLVNKVTALRDEVERVEHLTKRSREGLDVLQGAVDYINPDARVSVIESGQDKVKGKHGKSAGTTGRKDQVQQQGSPKGNKEPPQHQTVQYCYTDMIIPLHCSCWHTPVPTGLFPLFERFPCSSTSVCFIS